MRKQPYRDLARILFHLNGYTVIGLERFMTCGMGTGGVIDVPTAIIPPHLRSIGSRFYILGNHFVPGPQDSIDIDEIREALLLRGEEN